MALTGNLELLHIVDIIQLLNTTRKSGTFSVKGSKGESKFIFSNGHIVGASHLNNKVRIGSVMVKMGAITREELSQALEVQKKAGRDRKPLITTLIEMGKLGRDEAARGLGKLIEMTLVELIGWTEGTFTLDTEAITVSPECTYLISNMEQDISLDAQMVLMDALRIFDELERDRQAGKTGTSDEELFSEVISSEEPGVNLKKSSVLTADDLGLADIDHLERKIPNFLPVDETFDPAEIHRQKIREILADFTPEEQEAFVSFLEKSSETRSAYDVSQRPEGRVKGLIMFSGDDLLKHSVMTICKEEGVLVFATDRYEELQRIIEKCITIKVLPIVVLDVPESPEEAFSREKITGMIQQLRNKYSLLPVVLMASLLDYTFTLESFNDGIRTVFPKPSKKTGKATFITDTIRFLEIFKSYIKGIFNEQKDLSAADSQMSMLKERISALRNLNDPSAVSLAMLQYVSEICERAITFIVRTNELAGEKAIGVYDEKTAGPTSVTSLRVPLSKSSVLGEVIEKGRLFCGESEDEVLLNHLYEAIGQPLKPTIILLPVKSLGKTVTLTYGDFGRKEATDLQNDILEILADEAGLVLENTLYQKQLSKTSRKQQH
ncbi:MAG: DUF4388 domain-containing protein [Thermodesulfovibrionales bacterium]